MLRSASLTRPHLVLAFAAVLVLLGSIAPLAGIATGLAGWLNPESAGAVSVVTMGLIWMVLCLLARRQFLPGEPLRLVWTLMALGAGCGLAGTVLTHAGADNALTRYPGLVLDGPGQMALLAAALGFGLRVWRQTGVPLRLQWSDRGLMAVVVLFAVWEMIHLMLVAGSGRRVQFHQAVNVITDPLLCVLLIEALLIRRSIPAMGSGLILRCWGAFSAAVFLTAIGDMVVWVTAFGLIPVPLSGTLGYLSLLAGVCFALAPAYQLEACRRATAAGRFSTAC